MISWILVLTSLPSIIAAIKQLVEMFEVPGATGEAKKNMVLEVLKATFDTLGILGIRVPATVLLSVIDRLIDVIVAGYNSLGLFTHKG